MAMRLTKSVEFVSSLLGPRRSGWRMTRRLASGGLTQTPRLGVDSRPSGVCDGARLGWRNLSSVRGRAVGARKPGTGAARTAGRPPVLSRFGRDAPISRLSRFVCAAVVRWAYHGVDAMNVYGGTRTTTWFASSEGILVNARPRDLGEFSSGPQVITVLACNGPAGWRQITASVRGHIWFGVRSHPESPTVLGGN
jgi:hypothetical protein